MYLGKYEFTGDPDKLVDAYDRLMSGIPSESIGFHVCVRRNDGITLYDTCPTAEIFAETARDTGLRDAMTEAGLPQPSVTPLGPVHSARASTTLVASAS
jgi:hypothetical protein